MRLRRADPHTLAGAYALDALAEADRAAFERHLGACEACRQEAASLREAAHWLGAATAAEPPGWLREQVLAQATRTRQLPPPGPAEQQRTRTWRGFGWAKTPRLAVAVAGVCMLIALALGGLVLHTQRNLSAELARSRQIAGVLNARDATIMTAHDAAGGTATVVMSDAKRALVLTTARLPALPGSERYEVWLMGPRGDRSAGMLPAPHGGMTPAVVVSGLAPGDRLGLTVEPSGGSRHPTSPPVLMVVLPA